MLVRTAIRIELIVHCTDNHVCSLYPFTFLTFPHVQRNLSTTSSEDKHTRYHIGFAYKLHPNHMDLLSTYFRPLLTHSHISIIAYTSPYRLCLPSKAYVKLQITFVLS